MFVFYEQLGKDRNFDKVAKEFGKSTSFVSILSRRFQWMERVRQNDKVSTDPIVALTKPQVDKVRTQLVTVVADIADTLHELALISTRIKLDSIQSMSAADQAKVNSLNAAMSVFGVELKNPRALKDLLAVLKEVTRFNDDDGKASSGADRRTQIHAPNATLIIKDD